MSDEKLRELERRFFAGEENLADELIRRKITAAGIMSVTRRAIELALGSILDRRPTVNEVLFWLEHDALPCMKSSAPIRLRTVSPPLLGVGARATSLSPRTLSPRTLRTSLGTSTFSRQHGRRTCP